MMYGYSLKLIGGIYLRINFSSRFLDMTDFDTKIRWLFDNLLRISGEIHIVMSLNVTWL